MKEASPAPAAAAADPSGAEVPFDRRILAEEASALRFDPGTASIREMNRYVNAVERRLGVRFVRMEFGIPGLPVSPIAVEAEVEALRNRGVAHLYAPFDGIPELKQEIARFVKLFMDVEVPPGCCVPTVGAMQGCFVSLALAGRMREGARTVLLLEPGFPVNRLQLKFLGLQEDRIDFYDHRGDALVRAVEERARRGDLCALLWSSPNNPSWIVLRDEELAGLARVCRDHRLIPIEDLAYFGMDTRQDYSVAGQPPYQPTILKHSDRAVSIISSSKMFSYAGQRIAMTVVAPRLMEMQEPNLERYYGTASIGHALLHGALYPITASVPESPQYGLLALLRAVNGGDRSLFAPAREYSRRARIMKRLFLENGFRLVYDNDLGEPLADGFYFTVAYPGFDSGADLLAELIPYGVSAITLDTTGSCRTEGLRACVSLVGDDQFEVLEHRLRRFREDHPIPVP